MVEILLRNSNQYFYSVSVPTLKPASPISIKKPSNDSGLSLSLSLTPSCHSSFDETNIQNEDSPGIVMRTNLCRRKSLSGENIAAPRSSRPAQLTRWGSDANLAGNEPEDSADDEAEL